MQTFNPYTYQPMMRHFYEGAILPQAAAKAEQAARDNPSLAKHINSVWQFIGWMKNSNPTLYAAISNNRPDLLDPGTVVLTGSLAPNGKKNTTVKGMGAIVTGVNGPVDTDEWWNPASSSNSTVSANTSWGQQIADFAGKYLLLDQQRKIMDVNLKRAEQGLDPIDNVGAAVNVGITGDVKNMIMLAIGGVVLIGALSAMRKK